MMMSSPIESFIAILRYSAARAISLPRFPAAVRDRRSSEMVHHDLQFRQFPRDLQHRTPVIRADRNGVEHQPNAPRSLSDSSTRSCSSHCGSGSSLMEWRTPTSLPPRAAQPLDRARLAAGSERAASPPRHARSPPLADVETPVRRRAAPGSAPCRRCRSVRASAGRRACSRDRSGRRRADDQV